MCNRERAGRLETERDNAEALARSASPCSVLSASSRWPARAEASTRSGSACVPMRGVPSVYTGSRHPTADS
jgi:hypothetical protein